MTLDTRPNIGTIPPVAVGFPQSRIAMQGQKRDRIAKDRQDAPTG